MRAILQKVTHAQVDVVENDSRETVGRTDGGLMVLLGISRHDTEADARYIVDKTVNLRIFEDEAGKLNLSLKDTGGSVLLVSQFTLYADTSSGRRPSFSEAAPPEEAEKLYLKTVEYFQNAGIRIETGRFRTHMQVSLCNDGPVTLLLESRKPSSAD